MAIQDRIEKGDGKEEYRTEGGAGVKGTGRG